MFISLSKAFGKFRIGTGLRVTKKNAWWMFSIVAIVFMFKLMWYTIILS